MGSDILIPLIGVFGCVALLTGVVANLVLERLTPEQRRLRAVAPSATNVLLEQVQLAETTDPTLRQLSKIVPKSPKEMTRLRRRLGMAGLHDLRAAIVYSLSEIGLPVVVGLSAVMTIGGSDGLVIGAIAAVFGYLAPGIWLHRRTTQRQKKIHNGLPDALDLFIVCMEAGSSLDQAIVKASEELEISHPELTQELRFITTEIRAGKPRLEAFKNFANRTGVDDVRALVAMLVQTDRFGTSVAQALRTHASTSRTKRRQAAEERAGKVGVKLVFPLVLCLFPAVYVVCMGPVVIRIYRAFF
jgi:tight adherence protein C